METALPAPADLVQGYHQFKAGKYAQQADLYEALSDGQKPPVMVISCCDSRVDPGDIFDVLPGQFFVVRNVANLVPPCSCSDHNHAESAALEFAVTGLGVQHILVLGHAACGGVKAALSAANGQPAGKFIAPWVELLDKPRQAVLASGKQDKQTALEHAGIVSSLDNLMTFSFIEDAVEAGKLSLHGAWFAIETAELSWYDQGSGDFLKLET